MPRLPVPDVLLRTLARQLGGPSGPLGALVARMLNKGNGPEIVAAVGALDLTGSEEVADIGFGGGLGLDLLLDQTRDGGRVHVLRRRDNKDNRGGGIAFLYAYRTE